LVAQGEDLNLEFGATAETGTKGRGERDEHGRHIAADGTNLWPSTSTTATGTDFLAGTGYQ
jgi:hypothetical protein